MRSRRLSILFVLLSTPVLAQDLQIAEQQLAAALTRKDAAALEQLLAPSFVLRASPDVPRGTWIENALTLCWGDTFEISDFSIVSETVDTAIVSLMLTTHRDPMTCQASTIRSLLTDVWIRMGGTWRLALRHSGPATQDVAGQFAKAAAPPPRWERSAELSLVATGGNTDTQTLGTGMSVLWRPGRWTTRSRASYVRSVTADAVTAESLVAELRQSRALSARADAFARAEYLVDRFAGIGNRSTLEGGIGWLALENAIHSLKVDGGVGATHESRLTGEDRTFFSATLSSLYKWQVSQTVALNEQATVSSDVSALSNWRFQNALQLSLTVSRVLTVRLAHELKHVNRPVEGFRKTDTVLSVALVTRF